MDTLKFELGEYEEGFAWEVEFGVECSIFNDIKPCKHTSEVKTERFGESGVDYVTVPRVVVAYNEGHYCRTKVCLDCILEAAAKIEEA